MVQLTSTCHCKDFTHSFSIPEDIELPLNETTCSCDACRYRTGQISFLSLSAKVTQSFPPLNVLDKLKRYDQKCGFVIDQEELKGKQDQSDSDGLNKYSQNSTCGGTIITSFFCGKCGTKVYLQVASLGGEVEIGMWTLGALNDILVDNEPIVKLTGHHFLEDTVDGGISNIWTTFEGEKLKKHHDGSKEWSPSKNISMNTENYLHLHCKCGSFDAYVRRPQPSLPLPEGCYWYQHPFNDQGIPQRYMASFCACDSCRHITGSSLPAHPWVQIPFIDILSSPSTNSKSYFPSPMTTETELPGLTLYHSSPNNINTARYHCSTCGASILYFDSKRDFICTLPVGLNDSHNGVMNISWFSWWTGEEGHPIPPINAKDDGKKRWGKVIDEFEKGLIQWGRNIGQRQ
ncbi:uncharacterized protein I206_106273 [Kwoniella pini CBS 10737]|uniref:CENP-V/GFA domain-containing protein n=1 Tax=Kwoniella pini CBS 10737 TaxID=1296096 RepID=A0A1B9I1I1_9TREE|nr:uncharacterized protein I206_05099 [Kwoniella pini CBS 10737]OCF49406.1 hypothetical protein I206_05099 [Kwoniella pini CBS 10737]